jgi:translation initiation factor 2B subunit (eIF-2B alpha/beta/delta family)
MRREVAALARDRVSGAAALARRAARLLQAAARDDGKSLGRWQQDLAAAGEALSGAQPAMASLLTVVDLAVRAAGRARTPAAGARAVRRVLAAFVRRQRSAAGRAARRLTPLLPARGACLTLSSSEAVYRALVAAHRRGHLSEAIVAESRPGCEGVALARRLARRGVRVTLVVDALAHALVREVAAVVVGADAVTARGVWNKCGTLAVALGAHAARRPVIVATTEDRLVGPRLARRLRVPEAEPGAVIARPPRGVRAVNRLFDVTPLPLVRWIVTEAGARRPLDVRRRLAGRTSR